MWNSEFLREKAIDNHTQKYNKNQHYQTCAYCTIIKNISSTNNQGYHISKTTALTAIYPNTIISNNINNTILKQSKYQSTKYSISFPLSIFKLCMFQHFLFPSFSLLYSPFPFLISYVAILWPQTTLNLFFINFSFTIILFCVSTALIWMLSADNFQRKRFDFITRRNWNKIPNIVIINESPISLFHLWW